MPCGTGICISLLNKLILYLLTILKAKENVIPRNKDINENYLKHNWSFHLFRHKRKLIWWGSEHGRCISKLFDIRHPTHHRRWRLDDEPLIVLTTFISDNEVEPWSLLPRWETSFSDNWSKQVIQLHKIQPPKVKSTKRIVKRLLKSLPAMVGQRKKIWFLKRLKCPFHHS